MKKMITYMTMAAMALMTVTLTSCDLTTGNDVIDREEARTLDGTWTGYIDTYYYEKEHLPENQHFVRINHKETLAQVFTDIRYTRKDNEAMSKELIRTLVRQGFLPYYTIRMGPLD
jgi:hypothetical protein